MKKIKITLCFGLLFFTISCMKMDPTFSAYVLKDDNNVIIGQIFFMEWNHYFVYTTKGYNVEFNGESPENVINKDFVVAYAKPVDPYTGKAYEDSIYLYTIGTSITPKAYSSTGGKWYIETNLGDTETPKIKGFETIHSYGLNFSEPVPKEGKLYNYKGEITTDDKTYYYAYWYSDLKMLNPDNSDINIADVREMVGIPKDLDYPLHVAIQDFPNY